jgi:hypothetical protein
VPDLQFVIETLREIRQDVKELRDKVDCIDRKLLVLRTERRVSKTFWASIGALATSAATVAVELLRK